MTKLPSGIEYTSFSLKVETPITKKDGSEFTETLFLTCKGWGKLSEQCRTLSEGDIVSAEGRLKWEKWKNKNGEPQSMYVLQVQHIGEISRVAIKGDSIGISPDFEDLPF